MPGGLVKNVCGPQGSIQSHEKRCGVVPQGGTRGWYGWSQKGVRETVESAARPQKALSAGQGCLDSTLLAPVFPKCAGKNHPGAC